MTDWLYLPGWVCRIVKRPVKRAAIHSHEIITAHQHYRRARRFKRAAVGWLCIATGGIGAAIVPPLFAIPSAMPAVVGTSAPPGGIGLDTLPPVTGWEVIGPPILLPDVPAAETPTTPQRVPEPSSLALLAGAVAAMLIANRR